MQVVDIWYFLIKIIFSLEWLVFWIILLRVLVDVDFGWILFFYFFINGVYVYGIDVFLFLVDKNGNNVF